ncbi:hypothetical protein PEC18_33970 [Paucibacter sp. O1-1]|nr:hypothetical protein [Paucibacter sp. O1-1]MDA3830700.1 hypothetical protein [Paucibacter sp. O1-1]
MPVKQAVYESTDKPIEEALKAEAYWLYQATSKTPAIKRFTIADEQGLEHDIDNQRHWNELVLKVMKISDSNRVPSLTLMQFVSVNDPLN